MIIEKCGGDFCNYSILDTNKLVIFTLLYNEQRSFIAKEKHFGLVLETFWGSYSSREFINSLYIYILILSILG